MIRRFPLLLAVILSACAGVPQQLGASRLGYAKHMISKGDYDGAFSQVRDLLRSSASEDAEYRQKAIELIHANPQVVEAARSRITVESYRRMMNDFSEPAARAFAAEQFEALVSVIPKEEADEMRQRLDELARKGLLYISEPVFSLLTKDEVARLENERYVRTVKAVDAGVVVERQSADESTPGSAAGTQLGSAVGSAAYIDNAISGPPSNWNYSAKGHLAAGLLGGLFGSSLDRAPVRQYRFRYTLRLLDRSIVYRDVTTDSPLGHSNGVCISVSDLEQLPQELCELDVAGFRTQYLSK